MHGERCAFKHFCVFGYNFHVILKEQEPTQAVEEFYSM